MKTVRPKTPKKGIGKLKAAVKDPIEVFCRIRPLNDEMVQLCIKTKDDKTVILFPPDVFQNTKAIKEVHYSFKHVFDCITQKELFDDVCFPLVQNLLQGINGLLFTYGITSSGKTYTMTGNSQDGGLLPRSLDVIFNSIKDSQAEKYVFIPDKLNGFDVQSTSEAILDQQKELGSLRRNFRNKIKKEPTGDGCFRVPDTACVEEIVPDMRFTVFISYVEIYNNYIYDLLDDSPIDLKKAKCLNSKLLREDASHNMYVFGVTVAEAKTVEEALELFYKGQLRRRVSHTALNTESSRSHSVFTIKVVQAPLDSLGADILQDKDKIIVSQLSLVDLAGSERPVKTQNTGYKLREAGNINNSLMALRSCIEALREDQNQGACKMVPYRESKLTHLFKSFFEGEGKIRMIVCVNPRADYYDETIHVMRFAEMTQNVFISRPTPVSTSTVLGLTPGRGNVYKEAIRKAKEQGIPVTEVLSPTVYSLGPDFPQLVISASFNESMCTNLMQFLDGRSARRSTLVQDLNQRQEDFRKNLFAVDKDFFSVQRENSKLQKNLDGREQQLRNFENEISFKDNEIETLQRQLQSLEKENNNLQRDLDAQDKQVRNLEKKNSNLQKNFDAKNKQVKSLEEENTDVQTNLDARDKYVRNLEKEIANLQKNLDAKDRQIECIENEYQRSLDVKDLQVRNLEIKLSSKEEEIDVLQREVEEYKALADIAADEASERAKLERKLNSKDEKLRQLREKLNSDYECDDIDDNSVSSSSFHSIGTCESSAPPTGSGSKSSFGETVPKTRFSRIKSAIDFIRGNNPQSVQSPIQSARHSVDSVDFKENKSPNFLLGRRSAVVSNPRHRRTASYGGVWIEHKPIGNLELNTVLQPTMRRKKCVNKLKVKDVTKSNVSNYVLQHQEQDSQGEVETQLFKADIIPSAGGGAQVIFSDVEKLCQVSPPPVYNLRKRSGDNLPLREVEDRCTVSIGCHGLPSKIMKK